METFKKGQIVPRRLKMAITADRKAQHCVTFGSDVEIDGRVVRQTSYGVLFNVPNFPARRMNNGTYKKTLLTIKDVHFVSSKFARAGIVFCAYVAQKGSAQ